MHTVAADVGDTVVGHQDLAGPTMLMNCGWSATGRP